MSGLTLLRRVIAESVLFENVENVLDILRLVLTGRWNILSAIN